MKKKRHIGFGIVSVLMAVYPYIFILISAILGKIEENSKYDELGSVKFDDIATILFFVWIALMLVGPIMAVVRATTERLSGRQIAFWNMMIKLLLIPIHVLIAICALFSFLISFIPVPLPMFFIGIPLMLIFFILDYVLIIITSIYGFAAAGRSCRDHIISGGFAAGMIIMHCFVVLDVISSIILYATARAGDERRKAYIEGMNRAQAMGNMGYGQVGYNNPNYNNLNYNNPGYNNVGNNNMNYNDPSNNNTGWN